MQDHATVFQPRIAPGLIINADDLGIHPNINAGILSAYQHGLLTSCSMLMTTPFLEQTVRDFVRPQALPIGIHLSLTLGKAIAPVGKVSALVGERGTFRLSAAGLICSRLDRTLLHQIGEELKAQLGLARDCGLRPTHADSHQHVHMNPAVFAMLQELLPRYGIDRLRICHEPFPWFVLSRDAISLVKRLNIAKWLVLRWRSRQIRPELVTNDDFFGTLYSGAMTKKALLSILASASTARSTEISIHPGFPAPPNEKPYPQSNYNAFIASSARQMEHDALVDREVRERAESRGLVLRAFDGCTKA